MSEERIKRLKEHCEKQIRLSNKFNDIKHSEEHETVLELIKENQELKKHLEVPEHCNLKTLEDYKSYYEYTTKEKILEDTYIDYCAYVNLAHRYSELKKQLENCYCNRTDCSGRIKDSKTYDSLVQKLENQQKEFIEYMENEINKWHYNYDSYNYEYEIEEPTAEELLQTTLSKFKEIIGV